MEGHSQIRIERPNVIFFFLTAVCLTPQNNKFFSLELQAQILKHTFSVNLQWICRNLHQLHILSAYLISWVFNSFMTEAVVIISKLKTPNSILAKIQVKLNLLKRQTTVLGEILDKLQEKNFLHFTLQ